ncbi:uncharacterized protein DFL_005038 [Arthrobotrys flagrans]|uniref:Uncharacterized protein n=1 Tax=Arthrobotrys flagrans TaxID=97331 RepID=A0A437A6X5_ARTFL|nr:hypothetical protein DFL_005038 [Arthrobotrys flagrans]
MSSPIGPRRILHSRTFNDRTSLDAITEYTRNKLLDRERQYPSTYNTPTAASSFDGRGSGPASTADGGGRSHSPAHEVHCCCGQKTCEARVKNISVLSELEENLQTAAQLGQSAL